MDQLQSSLSEAVSSTSTSSSPLSDCIQSLQSNCLEIFGELYIRVGDHYQHHHLQHTKPSSSSSMNLIPIHIMANSHTIEFFHPNRSQNDHNDSDGSEKKINSFYVWRYPIQPNNMMREEEMEKQLKDILSLSFSSTLPPLPLKSSQSLSSSEVQYAESMACNKDQQRELPEGFLYDGQHYVDFEGHTFYHRPDLDDIIDEYVQRENESIQEYNLKLQQFNCDNY